MKPYRNFAGRGARGARHAGFLLRRIGISFMVAGGLILVVSVPAQVWFAVIGLILILLGFILLHIR